MTDINEDTWSYTEDEVVAISDAEPTQDERLEAAIANESNEVTVDPDIMTASQEAVEDADAELAQENAVVEEQPVAEEPTPAPAKEKAERRTPRSLEPDLRAVLDAIVLGSAPLGDDEAATPHILAARIDAHRGETGVQSAGAVAAALDRWADVGFITLSPKPKAFVSYTEAAVEKGLAALKLEAKAARKAAKEAAAPNQPAVAADPVVADES